MSPHVTAYVTALCHGTVTKIGEHDIAMTHDATPAVLEHDVPFPLFLRIMLGGMGLFLLIVPPMELWRGIWPLNLTTPFFGALVFAALSGAWFLLQTALFSPATRLLFRTGVMRVTEVRPYGTRHRAVPVEEIDAITVELQPDSDGPNTYHVAIKVKGGDVYRSRNFDTVHTAHAHADQFRAALGL